jgi:hypothetical protein
MTGELPKMRDRRIMQYLESGEWKWLWRLEVPVGERQLSRLIGLGWIERRELIGRRQIRITPTGLAALKAPLPGSSKQVRHT